MPRRVQNLIWPARGLVRSYAREAQPPFSTPDSQNCRSEVGVDQRQRGGSRPGLLFSHECVGAKTGAVYMLGSLLSYEANAQAVWEDNFDSLSTLNERWQIGPGGTYNSATLPTVYENDLAGASYAVSGSDRAATLLNISYQNTQIVQVQMFIVPYQGKHCGKYRLYAQMAGYATFAVAGTGTGGVVAELVLVTASGTASGTLKFYDVTGTIVGASTVNFSSIVAAGAGWFTLQIKYNAGNYEYYVYWQNTLIGAQTGIAVAGFTGQQVGFATQATVNGRVLIDRFRMAYKPSYTGTQTPAGSRVRTFASLGGEFWYESSSGFLIKHPTAPSLASDRMVQCADRVNKLYIADWGDVKVSGTDGVTVTNIARFDAASYADWTAASPTIVILEDLLSITATTDEDNFYVGTYRMTSLNVGYLGVTPDLGSDFASTGGDTATWNIQRGPKIYDFTANTLTLWMATTGNIPVGCPLICRYRDRMVLAGAVDAPHVWYMSRQGDPLDWNFGADLSDPGRAIGSVNADCGAPPEAIKALIPFGDDYLLMGLLNQIWQLRGDPAAGGQLVNVSRECGVIGAKSWCHGPAGETYGIGRTGFWRIAPGGESLPEMLSRDKLPRELLDIDPLRFEVLLEYDIRARGVHIFVTRRTTGGGVGPTSGGSTQWWYDVVNDAFWPVRIPTTMEPTAILSHHAQVGTDEGVVIGGRDGELRRFDRFAESDCGTQIESYCYLGPLRLGNDEWSDGELRELIVQLANETGPTAALADRLDVDVLVGDSAEEAYAATAFATYAMNYGLNYKQRPMARGASLLFKLSNLTRKTRWLLERMTAVVERLAQHRKSGT